MRNSLQNYKLYKLYVKENSLNKIRHIDYVLSRMV